MPSPKILMIYPQGGKFGILADHWFFDMVGQYSYMPPLGLMTVAGHFPRSWDIRLIDANIHPVSDEDIDAADYVMLSGLYTHIPSLCAFAERAAKRGKHVIVGGPVATTSYEALRGRFGISTICRNECEPFIAELVADIERGELKEVYGESFGRADMGDAAIPRFDLLPDLHRYTLLAMQTSRGCPFDCEFCDVPMLAGRKMRYKTKEQVKAELDALHAVVPKGVIFICDDNLTGLVQRCRDVLEALAEWGEEHGYPFMFGTQLSINVADKPETLELLFKANVRLLTCGIESPNLESLKEIHKVQNLKRSIEDRVHTMIRAGLEVYAFLMVGFDSDPDSIFDDQFDLVERANITVADLNILVALDHTPLGERIRAEGRQVIDTTYNTSRVLENLAIGMTNFYTKMDTRKLQEGYARLTERLSDPRHAYPRTRRMVELLPERDKHGQFLSMKAAPDSIFMVLLAFFAFPYRWLLFRQCWRLFWDFPGTWRIYRFIQSVFWIGVTHQEYARRARRTLDFLRDNPVSDPARGRSVEVPVPEKKALPVVS